MPPTADEIEEYRDRQWCREETRRIETAYQAERFVEAVGFAACLTDSRRPGPSLYVAVCGRRDAVLPRNVQKDEETSLAWVLKDEIVARGKVYYGKLARGKATFVAPHMVPFFHAVWGVRRSEEPSRLSRDARRVLRVLRSEWEMSTADLRGASGVQDRTAFARALDELQAAMIVVPSAVVLPALHLPLDPRGGSISRGAAAASEARGRAPRDRTLLPDGCRSDRSRRTGPRNRVVAAGGGPRKPGARG